MTAFLHGQRKVFFFSEIGYSKDQYIVPKSPSKGKRYLLTYNVIDVTECGPRENNGNVTMAQGAKQDFILLFTTKLMLQLWFPANIVIDYVDIVINYVSPVLIPDKNTPELRKKCKSKE